MRSAIFSRARWNGSSAKGKRRQRQRGGVEVGLGDEERELHHDRDRPRLAAAGQRERLADGVGDLLDLIDLVDALAHLLQQADVVQLVDLERMSHRAAVHINRDDDQRNAVEQGFANAAQGVGDARSRDDAADANLTRGASVAVSHRGGGELLGDEEIRETLGLECIPKLIVLSARNAKDDVGSFEEKGFGERLGPGHLADDPPRGDWIAARFHHRSRQRGQRPRGGQALEEVTSSDGVAHAASVQVDEGQSGTVIGPGSGRDQVE